MTTAAVRAVLSRVRYRPGWAFRLDRSGDVVVTAQVQDAYSRSRRQVSVRAYVVDPQRYRTEQHLLEQVRDAISSILHHEIGEWFKYRGKRWFDPHA